MKGKYFSFHFLLKSLLAFVIFFFIATSAYAWTCVQRGGFCTDSLICNSGECTNGCFAATDCIYCCFTNGPPVTPINTPTPPPSTTCASVGGVCYGFQFCNANCNMCIPNMPDCVGQVCCTDVSPFTPTPIPPTPTPTPDPCNTGQILCTSSGNGTSTCDNQCPGMPCIVDPGSTTVRHCQPRCTVQQGGVEGQSCANSPCCAACGFVFQCIYYNAIHGAAKYCHCTNGKCPSTCPAPTLTPTPGPPSPPCTLDSKGNCLNINTGIGSVNLGDNGTGFVGSMFGILLGFSGGIAILLIMYSGLRLITSQSNPEKIQQSREILTAAIVGLLFVIFSVVILEIIGIDIFHIPGLSR